MKRERSWTQIDYEHCYSQMRRGDNLEGINAESPIPYNIIQAADCSYQGKNTVMSGWQDKRRRERFHAIKWRTLSREEIIN